MSTPLEQFTVEVQNGIKNLAEVQQVEGPIERPAVVEQVENDKNRIKNLAEVQHIEKNEGILAAEPYYVSLATVNVRRREGIYTPESSAIRSEDSIKAQEYLAKLYDTGHKEMPQNIAKAFAWYNEAFSENQEIYFEERILHYLKKAEAAVSVAFKTKNFTAIKDYISILEIKSEVDYPILPETLYYLANIFENGYDGLKPENSTAFNYCAQAASKGNSDALFMLGYYCEIGIGTAKNLEIALECYENAVKKNNNTNAILRLKMYKAIKLGKTFFTENMFKTQEKLIKINKDNVEAHLIMAICYITGWGTKQDIIKGFNQTRTLAQSNIVAKIFEKQFEPEYESKLIEDIEQARFLEIKRLQELEKKAAKVTRKAEKKLQIEKEAARKELDDKQLAEKCAAAQIAAEAEKKRKDEAKKAAKAKRKAERQPQLAKKAAEKAQKEAEAAEKAKQEEIARKAKAEALAQKKQARKLEKETSREEALKEQQRALENLAAKNKKLATELEAKRLADEIAIKKLELDAKETLLKQQALVEQQTALKIITVHDIKLSTELEAKRVADEIARKKLELHTKEKLLQEQLSTERQNTLKQLEVQNQKLAAELQAKRLADELALKKIEIDTKLALVKKQKTEAHKTKKLLKIQQKKLRSLETQLKRSDVKGESEKLTQQIIDKKAALSATENYTKELGNEIACKQLELSEKNKLLMEQQQLLASINEQSKKLTETLHSKQQANEIERHALEVEKLHKNLAKVVHDGYFISALKKQQQQAMLPPMSQQNLLPLSPSRQITPLLTQQLAYSPQQLSQPPVGCTVPMLPIAMLPPGTIVQPLPYVAVQGQHNMTALNSFATQLTQTVTTSPLYQSVNQTQTCQNIISLPHINTSGNKPGGYCL